MPERLTQKAEIVAELGEQAVLLPALVQQALAANDRTKYYFSLLQTARQQAERPDRTVPLLRVEREAAGIEDAALDRVVLGAARIGDERYRVPHLGRILEGIGQAMDEMVRPFAISNARPRPSPTGPAWRCSLPSWAPRAWTRSTGRGSRRSPRVTAPQGTVCTSS